MGGKTMKKILIVEDQILLRDMLEKLINEQADMEAAGTTDDAALVLELCRKIKPDLVLMDVVTKNNSNGIKYAEEIRKKIPEIKIMIMTALPDITFVDEARKAGAHSFMDKDMGCDHLLYVIRKTLEGYSIYSVHADRPYFTSQFTEKEITVLRLVCQGKNRSEVAKEMGISEVKLKSFITSILDKSGFDNVMKFAIYAVGKGLIVPDQDWYTNTQ
jgi:DNA-binding NarL/FixJ family response regulator